MLAFSKLGASNAQSPSHVYELRLYHAKEGEMEALKARFGDHTDSIFKRHNMKSIGYWSPEDAPAPGPRTNTSIERMPCSRAFLAVASAVT